MRVPQAAIDELMVLDPATAGLASLRSALTATSRLKGFAEATEARILARIRELSGDEVGELQSITGASCRRARSQARTAQSLSRLPATLVALETGEITSEHASTITNAVENYPAAAEALRQHEAELVAGSPSVEQLTRNIREIVKGNDPDPNVKALRQHQRRRLGFFDGEDDMLGGSFLLPTEVGAEMRAALVAEAKRLWRIDNRTDRDPGDTWIERRFSHYLADAFVSLVRTAGGRASGSTAGGTSRPTGAVLALYNVTELTDAVSSRAANARLIDGTPMSVDTLRRLACQVGLTPGLVDDTGAVLYLGRHSRLASAAQRRALQTMFEGCVNCGTDWAWCEVHHVVPWELGGRTDLDNLVPVCGRCHHLVHEGGWGVVIPHLGSVEIFTPSGHLHKRAGPHSPPVAA